MTRSLLALLALAVAGCSSGDDGPTVFEGTEAALPTDGAAFTYYALRNNAPDSAGVDPVVPPSDSATVFWDFAVRGPEIVLNGGTSGPGAGVGVAVDRPYEAVADALGDEFFYRRDGESPCPTGPPRAVCTGPGDGWFERAPNGDVVPVPGRTLLLRLGDGRGYAKVAIDTYAGGPGGAATYGFRYAVNPGGTSFVEGE